MELLYIYIEDDGRNIKDCEFNFSPKYRFHYDKETNILTQQNLKNYIPNFWGDNIRNITAIIGKNGSGKTNLIEDVLFLLSSPNNNIRKIWYSYKGSILIYMDNNENLHFHSNIKELTHNEKQLSNFSKEFNETFQVIYYSPSTDRSLLSCFKTLPENIEDKSLGYLLRQIKGAYRPSSDNKADTTHFPIDSNELRSISDLDFWLFVNTLTQMCIINDYPEIEENYPIGYSLPKELVITFRQPIIGKHSKNTFQNRLLNIFEVEDVSRLPDFCGKLLEMEQKGTIIFPNGKNKYEYNSICGLRRCIVGEQYAIKIERKHLSKELIGSLSRSFSSSDIVLPFIDDVQKGKSMPCETNKFSLSWSGVSSGEFALFCLFSQLFTSIKHDKTIQNKHRRYSNIILCLDEAEQSFHPEWQREYVSFITDLLKSDIFNAVKFQVIIASHSPIVVSDFPKNNVVFLNKNENGNCKVVDSIGQENTFGANIHTLYKDSFFLEGAPIGEFAKNKITKLFEILRSSELGKDELQLIKNEIQLIGEPLLRSQLMKLYINRCDREERILELENELNELRGESKK